MMNMSFVEQSVDGYRIGLDAAVAGVTTDSRTVSGGELFVALRGERFDGHEFVTEAIRKGAAAVLVDTPAADAASQVVVDDTEFSLGRLAASWRRNFNIPVVAVTGSNGKTTVKTMISAILGNCGKTAASPGNFNNAIGLPLSLLELREGDRYAVMEIGMNQFGEIEQLSRIAAPTVAVITNAGQAHLMNLHSVDQVAVEKSSIVRGLKEGGAAILNADDPQFSVFRAAAAGFRVVTFGVSEAAEVSAQFREEAYASEIHLNTPCGETEIRLSLPGAHNVANALAAAAASMAAGATLADVREGLESFRAVPGRLAATRHFAGGDLLDDTYNSNPASLSAALRVLAGLGGDRRVVLGDMLELGDRAEQMHRKSGHEARELGIGRLYAYGELSRHAAHAFGRGARHYSSHREIVEVLRKEISRESKILVKGSRGMRMEVVVDGLKKIGEQPC